MFFKNQPQDQQEKYQHFLKIIGSLSNLYSDSKTPYLYYRIAEKLFCKAFEADDLSRSDVSADAKKGNIGIGLKTFLSNNNKTFQKIAEFNRDRNLYKNLKDNELIKKISELRNARITFTEKNHQINDSIYHCILREGGKFRIFESTMNKVNIGNIKNVKRGAKGNTILFDDGINDYSFSISKSTLSKRFETNSTIKEFEISILKDPLLTLEECFATNEIKPILSVETRIKETVYLPLYSSRDKNVQEKSGLNQWECKRTQKRM